MAKRYYITEDDSDGEAIIGVLLLVIGVLVIFSPGIVVTTLIRNITDLSISQCWGCSIITCIAFCACLHFFTETGLTFKKYAIWTVCISGFILLLTLFDNENCFIETVKFMLAWEE